MANYNIRQHFQYLSSVVLDLKDIIEELADHIETSLEILDRDETGTVPEGGDDDDDEISPLIEKGN